MTPQARNDRSGIATEFRCAHSSPVAVYVCLSHFQVSLPHLGQTRMRRNDNLFLLKKRKEKKKERGRGFVLSQAGEVYCHLHVLSEVAFGKHSFF